MAAGDTSEESPTAACSVANMTRPISTLPAATAASVDDMAVTSAVVRPRRRSKALTAWDSTATTRSTGSSSLGGISANLSRS